MRSIRTILRLKQLSGLQFYHFGQIQQFKLPDLGEKIKEATVKKWFVKEGDVVEEYQALAEVATDKLNTTIPASYSGRIHKILHQEEENCLVGSVLYEIETAEAVAATTNNTQSAEAKKNAKDEQKPQPNAVQRPVTDTLALPSVRNLAKQLKIKIEEVTGTGRDGRVLKEDLHKFLESQKQGTSTSKQPPSIPKQAVSKHSATATDQKIVVKMTPFGKGMQKSMTESNKIPTLYLKDEYDITALVFKHAGHKITFMSLFIKAFSMALTDYPVLNSLYDDSKPFEYTQVASHNITLAVDSAQGLAVPNIKNVQSLSLLEVQAEILKLMDKAKKGALTAEDLSDGTISISNIGTIGGTYTAPLILPPQICIVGIGRSQILPRYLNNELKPRQIINVSFGSDHRVVDGATVTRFSNKWKEYLENPNLMLLNLK